MIEKLAKLNEYYQNTKNERKIEKKIGNYSKNLAIHKISIAFEKILSLPINFLRRNVETAFNARLNSITLNEYEKSWEK